MMQGYGEFETQTASMLDDVVRDSLHIHAIVTGVLVWVWASLVTLFDSTHTSQAYMALLLILLAGVVSHHLGETKIKLAVAIYLIGFTTVITSVVLAYQTSAIL